MIKLRNIYNEIKLIRKATPEMVKELNDLLIGGPSGGAPSFNEYKHNFINIETGKYGKIKQKYLEPDTGYLSLESFKNWPQKDLNNLYADQLDLKKKYNL